MHALAKVTQAAKPNVRKAPKQHPTTGTLRDFLSHTRSVIPLCSGCLAALFLPPSSPPSSWPLLRFPSPTSSSSNHLQNSALATDPPPVSSTVLLTRLRDAIVDNPWGRHDPRLLCELGTSRPSPPMR
eukprot:2145152-Rhodomonas_salina.2